MVKYEHGLSVCKQSAPQVVEKRSAPVGLTDDEMLDFNQTDACMAIRDNLWKLTPSTATFAHQEVLINGVRVWYIAESRGIRVWYPIESINHILRENGFGPKAMELRAFKMVGDTLCELTGSRLNS